MDIFLLDNVISEDDLQIYSFITPSMVLNKKTHNLVNITTRGGVEGAGGVLFKLGGRLNFVFAWIIGHSSNNK
jgi:hypothetical protein